VSEREKRTELGFLGLGTMGGAMSAKLVAAGYPVLGFDIKAERLRAAAERGVTAAASAKEVVAAVEVILISVRSSPTLEELADKDLLPNARRGQTFVDLGTTRAPATRRIAEAARSLGAVWLDVPVSGGARGVREGTLRMFAGGDPEAYHNMRPILEALGDPVRIVYCGPSGAGQVVKAVNQLGMGLYNGCMLEALSLGARCGVDLEVIAQGVGDASEGWRAHISELVDRIKKGNAASIDFKYAELAYFLEEADEKDVPMPITRALFEFARTSTSFTKDNMGRTTPVLWDELMTRKAPAPGS